MKKRVFYNSLAKKYNLPYAYIKFTVDPRYHYRAVVNLDENTLSNIENLINWKYVKEDFERDRNREKSIFYRM
jgi:hypothetical protein